MARTRVDQYEAQVDRETVAGDGGTFGGSEKSSKIENLAINGDRLELIDNANHTETGGDQGATPGISLAVDDAVTFDRVLEGLGTAAGDGVAASFNFVSELLASWAQQPASTMVAPTPPATPTYVTTGSTVLTAGGSTVSKVYITDADYFELPNATDIGIAGFTLSTGIEWRPYVWNTGDNSCDLLIDLSAIPADLSVVYGAINFPRAESWSTNMPFPLALKCVGNKTAHNRLFSGAIFDLTIPEVAPRDIPKFSFTSRAFTHTRGGAGTRNSPATPFGTSMKEARLIVAKYTGSAGTSNPYTPICAFRAEVQFAGSVDADWCINDADNNGLTGWSRIQSPPMIAATFERDGTLPTGMTDTDWLDAVENQEDTANNVQVWLVFGNTPGRTITCYLPKAFARLHEYIDENGLGYEKVTFASRDNTVLCHMGQG
jgi:hypothetical protein